MLVTKNVANSPLFKPLYLIQLISVGIFNCIRTKPKVKEYIIWLLNCKLLKVCADLLACVPVCASGGIPVRWLLHMM